MILALLLAFAPGPTALDRCLQAAHGVRPVQHCQSVEIVRRNALIAQAVAVAVADRPREQERTKGVQALWSSNTDSLCFALARVNRGSLGSMNAMDCRLEAQAKRLDALGRPLGS